MLEQRSEQQPYQAIKERIAVEIAEGELLPGQTVPSENQLAKDFGVNRNQSRRALRELEAEGLVVRAQGRKTVVADPAQRNLAQFPIVSGKTVALVLPEVPSQYIRQITEGFLAEATQQGLHVITMHLGMGAEAEVEFLQQCVARREMAGLAIWVRWPSEATTRALRNAIQRRFPIVLIDRTMPEAPCDTATSDNHAIGYELTSKLVEAGRRRIAFACDSMQASSAQERLEGFQHALEDAGLAPWGNLFIAWSDDQKAYPAIMEAMARPIRPDAFFCMHEETAQSLLRNLDRLGYKPGQDIGLASLNDHEPGLLEGRVFCGSQDGLTIGRAASLMLQERIKRPDRPAERRIVPAAEVRSELMAGSGTKAG